MGSIDVPLGHVKDVKTAPIGRVCSTRGCKTILTQYNLNDYCQICMRKRMLKGDYEPIQD